MKMSIEEKVFWCIVSLFFGYLVIGQAVLDYIG